jgi:hypothetical protein
MGSTFTITPTATGRVLFHIQGQVVQSTAGAYSNIQLRYGTGTAPANAAAPTGTAGTNLYTIAVGSIVASGFHISAVATGLTKGTAYWFDLVASASSGTTTLQNVNANAVEC